MTQPIPDDMTELVDAQITRLDLVASPANGRPFVLMKKADVGLTQPLVPAEMVADLIKRADQETPVTDPANPIEKAEIDVTDAPEPDALVPEAPGGSTANSLPGSADWETLDGDTALNAVATLGRVKAALGWLADREAQEAVTGGDPDSSDNAWDLDDAACQLDWIIGRLAAFAVGEHMDADGLDAVGKAAAELTEPVAVVERLAPIAKAGRTLSAANEAALRSAAASIETVLNSLPQAPDADVTKTQETPAVTEPTPEPVDVLAKAIAALPRLDAVGVASALLAGGRTQEVAKAAGDPQLAVFDAEGNLIGTVDPAKLSPIATSPAAAKADEPADDAPADDSAPADAATASAAAPAADDDSRQIPGTDTVQAPADQAPADDTQTPAVAKAADPAQLEDLIKARVTEQVEHLVAQRLGAVEEQVRKFGLSPDHRNSPTLNGGTGVAGVVTRDGSQGDEFADLRKAVADAKTPSELKAAQAALNFAELRERLAHR